MHLSYEFTGIKDTYGQHNEAGFSEDIVPVS